MKNVNKFRTTLVSAAAAAMFGAGLAATDASAAGYGVHAPAKTVNFAKWDRLNIRRWPASYSAKVAHVRVGKKVFVERCILKSGADWCLIKRGWKRGWVNGKFVRHGPYTFAHPHPWF